MRLCFALLFPLCFAFSLFAADLSTTNREALQHFFEAAAPPKRPVTILSFGDSMADSYRSIAYVLMNRFTERMGVAGYSFNNYANSLLFNLTNGTRLLPPSSLWFSTCFLVPPGGQLWWTKEFSDNGILSDNAGIFYVSLSFGGKFTLSISTNGGPWGTLLTVDGFSSSPIGGFTNVALGLNFHRLRIDGLLGNNVILGPQLLNTRSSGINAAFTDYPGITLGQVTNVPLSIRTPIFQALAPDLLIWHMKEDGTEVTRQRLIECEQWWSNALPNCSVLYIGTPYVWLDTNTTWTIDQNTVVRSVALDYHRAYMDCMTPSVSYDWMLSQGFMSDETHLNYQGSSYLAGFVWGDLGFFSLRAPHSLTIQSLGQQIRLSYGTAPNILYTLESSEDRILWEPLVSTTGTGMTMTTNLQPTGPPRWFHLRLNPGP
jgi:hypothetical protein